MDDPLKLLIYRLIYQIESNKRDFSQRSWFLPYDFKTFWAQKEVWKLWNCICSVENCFTNLQLDYKGKFSSFLLSDV